MSGSALVLLPLVCALESMAAHGPMLKTRVARLVVQSAPGKTAKPALYWGPGQGTFLPLVYSVGGDRGGKGCFTEVQCQLELHKLLGLPPPQVGAADKVLSNVSKVGTEMLGKTFSKLGFGKKKK